MSSSIDPTYPTSGTATTQSVRDNFSYAKTEIEALQLLLLPTYLCLTGDATLTNERTLVATSPLVLTDAGAGGNLTLTVGYASPITLSGGNLTVGAGLITEAMLDIFDTSPADGDFMTWNAGEGKLDWTTASVSTHDLLSATHTDTLADTVIAGDILIGNATPKWSRLAKSTNGYVLTLVSGLPAWAAAPTGQWVDAADHIYASNATSVKVYDTGNVSIGSSSSVAKLDVAGVVALQETTAPSATSSFTKIYSKSSDSLLYCKNDAGTEYLLSSWIDAGTYYRAGNVTDSGNTAFRIYDAGYTQLGTGSASGQVGQNLDIGFGSAASYQNNVNPSVAITKYSSYTTDSWSYGALKLDCTGNTSCKGFYTLWATAVMPSGSSGNTFGATNSIVYDHGFTSSGWVHSIRSVVFINHAAANTEYAGIVSDVLAHKGIGSRAWSTFNAAGWTCCFQAALETDVTYPTDTDIDTAYCMATSIRQFNCGLYVRDIKYHGIYFDRSTGNYTSTASCLGSSTSMIYVAATDHLFHQGTSSWAIFRTGTPGSSTDRFIIKHDGRIQMSWSATTPSSLLDGDMWYDGSVLRFRQGSTTKVISWT